MRRENINDEILNRAVEKWTMYKYCNEGMGENVAKPVDGATYKMLFQCSL